MDSKETNPIKTFLRMIAALFLVSLVYAMCSSKHPASQPPEPSKAAAEPVSEPKVPTQLTQVQELPVAPGGVKNVILMIGDGMGVQQVSEALMYRQLRRASDPQLAMELLLKDKTSGLMRTTSYGDIVTDSAASATAMACGEKVLNETLGLDPNGFPCETILEKASKMGKGTGLVSTTRITHATPAAFASHEISRDMENEIADDLIEKHEIDVLLSGGVSYLIPQYKDEIKKEGMKVSDVSECAALDPSIDGTSKRKDQKNLIAEAKSKHYQFACKAEQLDNLEVNGETKVLGLFAASVFPMIEERRQIGTIPTLAKLTDKALEILAKKKNGFFLMVEGGLIDFAAHDNDAGTMLQETLDFDESIRVAMDFVDKNPDTLLIVTADHETGGFGFAYGEKIHLESALPSGLSYHKPYDFAAFTKFDYLINQKKSFRAILDPIVGRLYSDDPAKSSGYTLDLATKDLLQEMKANTQYEFSEDMAKTVLFRKPGEKDASPTDFHDFYVHSSIHPDMLGRQTAEQSHVVWAAGTHTSTPVLVMASGPKRYADRVHGWIDNTDIEKIIEDAFNGR